MARVRWIVRLVETSVDGEGQTTDVMEIAKPDGLCDIATLGLSLAEAKPLLAAIQREVVAAQASNHALRRPTCRSCGQVCQVKDYRQHRIATRLGQVTVRLPRFCWPSCGGIDGGVDWPSHCRSTPELDRPQAHLSALMTIARRLTCWSRCSRSRRARITRRCVATLWRLVSNWGIAR
jgi:hypothetical protein